MTERITSGQRDSIVGVVTASARKVLDSFNLDKDAAQLVFESGDELAQIAGDAVRSALIRLSVSQEYANEEVPSTYTYPPEYTGPAPIIEQITKIAAIFGLNPSQALEFAKSLPELPEGAEGWFAIPSVKALAAKHFAGVKDPAEQYLRVVELVLKKIAESRSFYNYNYREGQFTAKNFRQSARTAAMFEKIAESQKSDILVIPAQFGLLHRGKSVRRARATFRKNEFGLGAFAEGCMILTHPKRFIRWKQLHTDCSGDEFVPGADGEPTRAPFFDFCGKLKFSTYFVDYTYEYYGSVSGFLPQ